MNGSVLSREVGDDIKKLQGVDNKTSCKACSVIRDALVRSLRMCEDLVKSYRLNTVLLIFIAMFVVKVDNIGVIELLLKIIMGG